MKLLVSVTIALLGSAAVFSLHANPSVSAGATSARDVQARNPLPAVQPLRIQRSATVVGHALAVDPSNSAHIAYCDFAGIEVTFDGGPTWSTVPTAGAATAAAQTQYPLWRQDQSTTPACVSVLLDPVHPQSLFATFSARKLPYDPPPIFFAGYYTTDGGGTWRAAPLPDGYDAGKFGGFQMNGAAIEALLSGPASLTDRNPNPLFVPALAAEQTVDGGETWRQAQPSCPETGPCVRFGAAPNAIGSCSMTERVQPIVYSSDGGRTWTAPDFPKSVNACVPNELVTLSASIVLLLSAQSDHPALVSHDGGQTWQAIDLPPLPPSSGTSTNLRYLRMLPDGSLLALNDRAWLLLVPETSAWCSVAGAGLPIGSDSASLRVVGDQLWWLQDTNSAAPVPAGVPLASMSCGG